MSHTHLLTDLFETIRRPEYTGENRCVACTVVNLAIATVLAVAASMAWPPAGAIIFGGCLLAIYLRGYLVPGTPTLTERYFPAWLLARFDKTPEQAPETAPGVDDPAVREGEAPEFLETVLVSAGVLEGCAEGADLCLTPGFRRAWHDRIETHRDDSGEAFYEALAVSDRLDVDPDQIDVDRSGSGTVASAEEVRIARWESEAAYVADIAAAAELDARYDAWAALGFESRTQILGGLRLWLDWCPDCDGPVAFEQQTVESCCRSRDVLVATCQDCAASISSLPGDIEDLATGDRPTRRPEP